MFFWDFGQDFSRISFGLVFGTEMYIFQLFEIFSIFFSNELWILVYFFEFWQLFFDSKIPTMPREKYQKSNV